MVTHFLIDYMHLVCLGVMRRLLNLWMRGPLPSRLKPSTVDEISRVLIGLQGFIPKEFARKPRSLRDVDRWKATEFRQFLLFTGPVALRGKLSESMYHNFMLFHVGIFILVNRSLCTQYCDFADQLLVMFVTLFAQLYGRNMLVYNVHGLVHLADEVRQFGCLDNVSAFPFENFLPIFKRLIRKPNFPLQQIINILSEIGGKGIYNAAMQMEPLLKGERSDGPVPCDFQSAMQYKDLCIRDAVISKAQGHNCTVSIADDIVMVRNILRDHGEIYLVVENVALLPMRFRQQVCPIASRE